MAGSGPPPLDATSGTTSTMPPPLESMIDKGCIAESTVATSERVEKKVPATNTMNQTNSSTHNIKPDEEETLMDKMMREATIEDEKKRRLKKAHRRREIKKFGNGMKGGFFNKKKKKTVDKKKMNDGESSKKNNTDNIPSLKASNGNQPGTLPEVQAAMNESLPQFLNETKDTWGNAELLQRVKNNPKLCRAMADPRFAPLMKQMQVDPNGVMEMAKSSPELAEFLKLFGSVVGEHFESLGAKQNDASEKKEKKRKAKVKEEAEHKAKVAAAQADPRVKQVLENETLRSLLEDEEVKLALQKCQEDPNRFMRVPKMRSAFLLMQQAGLVQIHPNM